LYVEDLNGFAFDKRSPGWYSWTSRKGVIAERSNHFRCLPIMGDNSMKLTVKPANVTHCRTGKFHRVCDNGV
jgi:hypothetical protein